MRHYFLTKTPIHRRTTDHAADFQSSSGLPDGSFDSDWTAVNALITRRAFLPMRRPLASMFGRGLLCLWGQFVGTYSALAFAAYAGWRGGGRPHWHAYAVALIKVIDILGTAISTSAEMTPGRLRGTARHLVRHLRSRVGGLRDRPVERGEGPRPVDRRSGHRWPMAMVACILTNCITGEVSMWLRPSRVVVSSERYS